MKKTLLLLLALLTMGVGNAWATKLYATYGTPASNGEWDAETSTYTWTGSSNNLMTIFTFSSGELAQYKSIHLTTSDYVTGPYRICFMNGGTAVATIAFYSAGQKDINFADRDETKNLDMSQITHISFGGNSGAGSVKLTKAYLEKPMSLEFDENGEAEIDVTDLTASGCLSLDDQTGVLTSTLGEEGAASWGRLAINFPSEGVDLTYLTGFSMGYSGTVLFNNFEIGSKGFWSSVTGRNDLANYIDDVGDKTKVTTWRWNVNAAGTMTITSLKLKASVMTATDPHYTILTATMFHKWTGVDADAEQTADAVYPSNDLNTALAAGATVYGDGNVSNLLYADLTDYDKLIITGTAGTSLRVLLNRQADNSLTELNPTFASNGTLEVDLTPYKTSPGYVHLNAIKRPYDNGTATITSMLLYKANVESPYDYVFTGSGVLTASATAALADATVTLIDATGVTGTGIELSSANPNAIFVANSGVLSNTSNVCVGTTIANLALTDGYPFTFPEDATATDASYTRTMPNTFGTICLPFAVSSDENVQYYTTNGVVDGALQLEEAANVAAGTPAIVFAEGKSLSINGSGTLAVAGEADGDAQLIGSFAEQVIDVTEDASKNYYGIANNQFTKATSTLTVKPFRAYLTTTASSPAKLRLGIADDEASAISALTADDATVKAIYNASGAKQQCLQKGLNIVKMSNGVTTKVFVK